MKKFLFKITVCFFCFIAHVLSPSTSFGNYNYTGELTTSDGLAIQFDAIHYADVYTFDIRERSVVQIFINAGFSHRMYLYSESGLIRASSTASYHTTINRELYPGTYHLEITTRNSGATGYYEITSSIELIEVPTQSYKIINALDDNDRLAIGFNSVHYADVYIFNINERSVVQIFMNAGFSHRMYLYSGSIPNRKNLISASSITDYHTKINRQLYPGTYCVEITTRNSSVTGYYELISSIELIEASRQSYQLSGTLDETDRHAIGFESAIHYADVYIFRLDATANVQIFPGAVFNHRLYLYSGNHPDWDNLITDGRSSYHTTINRELAAGNYCIEITTSSSGVTGSYEIISSVELTEKPNIEPIPDCPSIELLGCEGPRVETLRRFRDEILATSPTGAALIRLYYDKSQEIIDLCNRNPAVKRFFKNMLERIIPAIGLMLK